MEQAILKALVYFDLFSYPLTTVELWKYAPVSGPCTLPAIMETLLALHERGLVHHDCGFWMLPGRVEIVALRVSRYTNAERKYSRVGRAVRFLKRVSSIRMIAVANTLAWNHAREESDIDFFIASRPGAVWKSRLLGVTPFALLGLRPRASKERDTFCFSFFAAESALDFAPLAHAPEDPYLLYWIATLVPVYDPDGLIEGLWDANPWVRERLPNAWCAMPSVRRRVVCKARAEGGVEATRGMGEEIARALQLAWLPSQLRSMMNVDSRVVITDDVLKFHVNDRREEIAERYRARCAEVGI